jgi:hypothetical protein
VLYRSTKQHQCPFSKGESNESGEKRGKGNTRATPKLNKPAPKTQDAPPAPPTCTTTTATPQAKKKQDQDPSKKKKTSSTKKPQQSKLTTSTTGPCKDAHTSTHMYSRELASDQPYENTSDRCSLRLNIKEKCRTRRGLMNKMQG